VRAQILKEIQKITLASGGQPPGSRAFESKTGIREAVWRGVYWARWGDALKEAGFAPNERREKIGTDLLIQKFVEAARHYTHLPSAMELRMYQRKRNDFPNEKTIHSHFGSKNELLANLRTWVTGREGYEDVVAMFGSTDDSHEKSAPAKEGLVYLMKSGAHYKIGRSDELERRVKEIRIALPEAASLVHSIRTDDPAGIEAYWHRRFVDRRANGEWFKLTASDVKAFKRRKYQ
jgi:hypothetical protein